MSKILDPTAFAKAAMSGGLLLGNLLWRSIPDHRQTIISDVEHSLKVILGGTKVDTIEAANYLHFLLDGCETHNPYDVDYRDALIAEIKADVLKGLDT